MTTDPIVIQLDERAAKLLLDQRDQYIRQSAETRGGKVAEYKAATVRREEIRRY